MSTPQKLLVNLGCGSRFHPAWRNFDLRPVSPEVSAADFIKGIPLADQSANAVYHSHVLEHLPREAGLRFLAECHRVLTPGGILRVVVPDLEQSAREYIAVLDARRQGQDRTADHDWMLIELLDQMVRESPGGDFSSYLKTNHGNDQFLLPRLGGFGAGLMNHLRTASPGKPTWRRRVFNTVMACLPRSLGENLQLARYRRAGEVHLWMYDELSLGDALRKVGFETVVRQSASSSLIPDFSTYHLDADADGSPWKGVSLYMEARR